MSFKREKKSIILEIQDMNPTKQIIINQPEVQPKHLERIEKIKKK